MPWSTSRVIAIFLGDRSRRSRTAHKSLTNESIPASNWPAKRCTEKPITCRRAVRTERVFLAFANVQREFPALTGGDTLWTNFCLRDGGQGRNRTADASLFRAALYRLSYLAASLRL